MTSETEKVIRVASVPVVTVPMAESEREGDEAAADDAGGPAGGR